MVLILVMKTRTFIKQSGAEEHTVPTCSYTAQDISSRQRSKRAAGLASGESRGAGEQGWETFHRALCLSCTFLTLNLGPVRPTQRILFKEPQENWTNVHTLSLHSKGVLKSGFYLYNLSIIIRQEIKIFVILKFCFFSLLPLPKHVFRPSLIPCLREFCGVESRSY